MAVDLVGAANRGDLEVIAVARRDSHAIATDDDAAIVRNAISNLLNVEAFVNRAIERVELRLSFQSLAEPPLLLASEEHCHQLAHSSQYLQIATERRGTHLVRKPDLQSTVCDVGRAPGRDDRANA